MSPGTPYTAPYTLTVPALASLDTRLYLFIDTEDNSSWEVNSFQFDESDVVRDNNIVSIPKPGGEGGTIDMYSFTIGSSLIGQNLGVLVLVVSN